ncbi:MAG: alpha-amylase family glycosyl hydrolase [Bacteroidales bacterium]|nr:alpha-amylase family glycosyl hydrolase [Bacteroidales bacterium]
MHNVKADLNKFWKILYPDISVEGLDVFFAELQNQKRRVGNISLTSETLWYKKAVVYSLYVDLFSNDFEGLIQKLPYLQELGINCLWLLPILESPMKDAGFDISDYKKVRDNLLGPRGSQAFDDFLKEAHKLGIKVIFDIAINHTSDKHEWFIKSSLPEKNKYTNYYIWSDNDKGYSDCRLLFKGMCDSNWEKLSEHKYYFHRFFEFQPDLNYRNPEVLLDMCRNFMFWIEKGVDGFRADAIPYLWKEEGTDCENLDNTHVIIKFFRKVVEFLNPEVILLAEACQPPKEVVKYFGQGDECHAGYHFPLMPQIYKAMALESLKPIINVLSSVVTPEIPENAQWFTFLRCHDELSLELVYVSEEDRKFIHDKYCHNPDWDFRRGEGISARLSELFKFDTDKIIQAFSIMLTLGGTPIIYYGDEFGKPNDKKYYEKQIKLTGHNDTRNLVRGRIDWTELEVNLKDKNSFQSIIFNNLKKMITIRNGNLEIQIGKIEFINVDSAILAYKKTIGNIETIVLHNLSQKKCILAPQYFEDYELLFGNFIERDNQLNLEAKKTIWLKRKIKTTI